MLLTYYYKTVGRPIQKKGITILTANTNFDIIMIGHFAKDRIVVDGQGKTVPGGAVFYGSVALRRSGMEVGVVTRLHPNDFPYLDEMKQAGVQLFAAPAPDTSGIENLYNSADMERRICKLLSFAGPFQAADIPNVTARIYAIVPIIAGEVDLDLLKMLAERGPVALDIQGFVRVRENGELVFRQWSEMEEGLSHVTYLKVDRAEAELLTGLTDLAAAARRLTGYGPREVVVTQSSGVTVYADGQIYRAPFTPRSLVGRTGRGDTCFATYLGRRLTASPQEATRLAAAITTLKQEQPGPWRGPLANAEALMARTPIV
jgi:sugar/nucleoside kinase (ribokinase family)